MSLHNDIARIANLMGDATRASILIALMDGRALTAGELAIQANISPQTASNHLNKLSQAKLIVCESSGRHRYYKIASPDVAKALESISLLTAAPDLASLHSKKLDKDICFARSCYDHLAGTLGVKITLGLVTKKYLILHSNKFSITNDGKLFFDAMGINCEGLLQSRRKFANPCFDWTERKYHLAGSLGTALLDYFINHRLFMRSKYKPRVILLTSKGRQWLKNTLDIVTP